MNLFTSAVGAELMVGREGVEPSTSRLSGVRSNHLSYRPPAPCRPKGRRRREPAQAYLPAGLAAEKISRMKGHEDGGMFFGQEEAFRPIRTEVRGRRFPP